MSSILYIHGVETRLFTLCHTGRNFLMTPLQSMVRQSLPISQGGGGSASRALTCPLPPVVRGTVNGLGTLGLAWGELEVMCCFPIFEFASPSIAGSPSTPHHLMGVVAMMPYKKGQLNVYQGDRGFLYTWGSRACMHRSFVNLLLCVDVFQFCYIKTKKCQLLSKMWN